MSHKPQRGGVRANAGQRSAFPGKEKDAVVFQLCKDQREDGVNVRRGRSLLLAATTRLGVSRGVVIEQLLRQYGSRVKLPAPAAQGSRTGPASVYPGKDPRALSVRLTAKAHAILTAARSRNASDAEDEHTWPSVGDVLEHMLRGHGTAVTITKSKAKAAA